MVGWICDEDTSLRHVDILCLLGFSSHGVRPTSDELLTRIALIRTALHPDRLRKRSGVPKEIIHDRDITASNANTLNHLVGSRIGEGLRRDRWKDMWRSGKQDSVQRWNPLEKGEPCWTRYFLVQPSEFAPARLAVEFLAMRQQLVENEKRTKELEEAVAEGLKQKKQKEEDLEKRQALEQGTTLIEQLRRLQSEAITKGYKEGSVLIGMIRHINNGTETECDVVGSVDAKGRLNLRARIVKSSLDIKMLDQYFGPFGELTEQREVVTEIIRIVNSQDIPEDILGSARHAAQKRLQIRRRDRQEYLKSIKKRKC